MLDSVKSLCMKLMSKSVSVFEKRISPSRAWIRPLLRMLGSWMMWERARRPSVGLAACKTRSIFRACCLNASFWACDRYGHATVKLTPGSLSWTSTWRPLIYRSVSDRNVMKKERESKHLARKEDLGHSNISQDALGYSNSL